MVLNTEQVANFTYWMTECTEHRGAKKLEGRVRIAFINYELIPKFLKKYPTGILTGWN